MALLAYALAGLVAVVGVLSAVLVGQAPDMAGYVGTALALGLFSVVLGVLVARRRPHNVVAPLLVLVGASPVWVAFGDLYTKVAEVRPGLLPVWDWYVAFSPGTWMVLYVPAALLMLYFPDGRLLGPRWRWVVVGLVAVPLAFAAGAAGDPAAYPAPFAGVRHPYTLSGWIVFLVLALLPVFLGLLVASVAAMIVRYRRAADPVSQAQVKWFALGALFLPATLLLCWASYLFTDSPNLVLAGLAATFVALPAATAIALLRHDLYDVDKAMSAAATYGLVTAVLLGFYTVAAFLVGLGAGGTSPVAAAAATAVCAAVLAPLRVRLQRRVDRRLYPARRAALAAIEVLGDRTHAGEASPEQLEEVLRTALRDPGLRVGYLVPGESGLVSASGAALAVGDSLRVPVRAGGHEIGALLRGTVGSRSLLRELADAAALLVELVAVRIELRQALSDVESSRTRLLQAGYAERRRLERDLHDGAQQRLVSLGMSLRLAQRHLGDGTVDVDGLLDESVASLGLAVAELRQIANGLRPSSLDDGLGPALSSLASKVPIPVALDVCADPVPDDVATTAFFVASEALTNAVKHASPGSIGLRVARLDGRLTVRVSDDGAGGAVVRPGAGLAGLADRVAAAGGLLSLTSPSGRGTVVEVVLPCAS
ncbi:histidine kinase [Asanoa sp. NPDC049573]|uniref:sensor histidine kinase n=1 Tax=Asanoa sp. NPDC049573 TaxID=3155396 RepID=UPI00343B0577